jgi:hypothetical protein
VTIEGIGELRPQGEFWVLTYANCGHEQWFMRHAMNYADDAVRREVLARYASCDRCHPPPRLV